VNQTCLFAIEVGGVMGKANAIRFYRPDRHMRMPKLRSPEFVQMGTATAVTPGLVPGTMCGTSCTSCLNFLATYADGCRAALLRGIAPNQHDRQRIRRVVARRCMIQSKGRSSIRSSRAGRPLPL
jgi:hypothetical protein